MAVIFEKLREFAVDAGSFDVGGDIVHVSFAEHLPDVFALDATLLYF